MVETIARRQRRSLTHETTPVLDGVLSRILQALNAGSPETAARKLGVSYAEFRSWGPSNPIPNRVLAKVAKDTGRSPEWITHGALAEVYSDQRAYASASAAKTIPASDLVRDLKASLAGKPYLSATLKDDSDVHFEIFKLKQEVASLKGKIAHAHTAKAHPYRAFARAFLTTLLKG